LKIISHLNAPALCPFQLLLDMSAQFPIKNLTLERLAFSPIDSQNDVLATRASALVQALIPTLATHHITQLQLHIVLDDQLPQPDTIDALLMLAAYLKQLEIIWYILPAHVPELQQTTQGLENHPAMTMSIESIEVFMSSRLNSAWLERLQENRQDVLQEQGFA
jgi:hypothetical protein